VPYWTQQYDPMGYWPALGPLLAALPVLVLLGLLGLGVGEMRGRRPLAGLVTAGVVAGSRPFGMPPELVLASATVGVVFALFRIVWLIVAAVFLYGHRGGDRPVRGDEGIDRPAPRATVGFQARPGRVSSFGAFIEGSGRVRGAGGHLGRVPGRPGVRGRSRRPCSA